MAVPFGKWSFVTGELSPDLFGRIDLARQINGASTMRNMFVGYRGGAYSRAGTAFVGFSKQTGRTVPPRMVPFQFSINQGLALEFGNQYMRVISDGGYVTDVQAAITNISNANPCVITASSAALGAQSATSNNGGVTRSYAPADLVTLAGGIFSTATQLRVTTTQLAGLSPAAFGQGYVPGDTINLNGGTQTTQSVISLTNTQVATVAFNAFGTPSVSGTYVMQGTTGTGTKFTVSVKSHPGTPISILTGGAYTVNPTSLSAEPMVVLSGPGTWTGLTLTITMGVGQFTFSNAGVFTANPAGGTMTQGSTSGSGTGATFALAILGPHAVTVNVAGVYTTYPANPVAQASTTGTGLGATFTVTTTSVPNTNFVNGDWVFLSGIGGTTQLNGLTVVVSNASGNSFTPTDVFGNTIDSTGFGTYTSGGIAARLFTLVTPYAEADLPWLKFTQSADVMSLACVNQNTDTEYAPYDLARLSDSDWTLTQLTFAATATAPTNLAGSASTSGSVDYAYVVTAVSPTDGSESIASNIASITSAVNISATAGTISLNWTPSVTPNVDTYNVYKAEPGISTTVPAGSLFGFVGTATGTQFIDSNIIADFSQVPPTAQNPFARGAILGATVTNSTGTVTSVSFTISTATGSGAVLEGVIISSQLVAILVLEPGQNYGPNDTVTVNVIGGGSATATLQIGPQSGTYPGCATYFQQRRVYGFTLNEPDTYFMSQPGSFTNFDFRIPTIDSDAITGSPWSVQVDGIQFLVPMPAGLLVFTGKAAWLLVGAGSFATNVAPISPSSQTANPQPDIGCSATVPPVKIDYDVLFVSSIGSYYYDLPYQLYALSEPIDLTVASAHLFTGFTIEEHAWCRNPAKILWSVRSDGTLLSLTYLKPEQISGWGRHDTFGSFESVCAVTEPPVDALYVATQRTLGLGTAYIVERMDNRLWPSKEACWCVDCGFTVPQPQPQATLSCSTATGLGSVTGGTVSAGGQNYSAATTGSVIDAPLGEGGTPGPGTGAVPSLTFVGGVLNSVTFSGPNQGSGYLNPQLVLTDPSNNGSGAVVVLTLNNAATFTASAGVFSAPNVGSVIRAGGCVATITGFTDSQHVTANITVPWAQVQTDATGTPVPIPQAAGSWTMTAPVSSLYIPEFAGCTFTGLADGVVIPPTAVGLNGIMTLPNAATFVTVGFGFTAQLQTPYLQDQQPTIQGQRKKVATVTARLEATGGFQVGSNQPDGSTLSPPQLAPAWTNLDTSPPMGLKPYNATFTPLYTGDTYAIPVTGGFQKPGQVAFQQSNPLPFNLLAVIASGWEGDIPEQQAKVPEQRRAA